MKPLPIMAKLVRRSLAALLALVLAFIIYVGYHLEAQPAPTRRRPEPRILDGTRRRRARCARRGEHPCHQPPGCDPCARFRPRPGALLRDGSDAPRGGGELAELLGRQLLPIDRARRPHRFRERARRALSALPPAQLAWLEAYADGVREGLADLGASPFPHRLLFLPFRSWTPEDSLLVVYAMYFDLQGRESAYDLSPEASTRASGRGPRLPYCTGGGLGDTARRRAAGVPAAADSGPGAHRSS